MAHNEPPHQDLRCLQIQLFLSLVVKELKRQTKIAADDTLFFYSYLTKEIRLDVSCESSARHIKYQVLFSLKNNEKVFINVVCCSHDWCFKGKSTQKDDKICISKISKKKNCADSIILGIQRF